MAPYTSRVDIDSFIATYRSEWTRLEAACAEGGRGLSSLSGAEIREMIRLYLRASSHLAQARAEFHDPRLDGYLNGLVTQAHAAIYSTQPRTKRGFVRLFAVRYPEALRRTSPFVFVAAGILLVIVLAAWAWVATSPEAQIGLLPPAARDAIREVGGRSADLGPPASLSAFILFNNVLVAFLAFALGITFCVGTIVVLVKNALLLGVLAGAFQVVGNAGRFWLLILPHGVLELFAICIAAGAGLRMGWSLIDPGDRPRGRALRDETREAVVVVIGVIPAFVIAALIEGFITGTALPDALEIVIGLAFAGLYVIFLLGWPARLRRTATGAPRP
jgi:uncharacterized membrane protein SpoIIM required for sporulation